MLIHNNNTQLLFLTLFLERKNFSNLIELRLGWLLQFMLEGMNNEIKKNVATFSRMNLLLFIHFYFSTLDLFTGSIFFSPS